MSFVQRIIVTQLVLGKSTAAVNPGQVSSATNVIKGFIGPNSQTGNVLTLSGLRTSVSTQSAGGWQNAAAQVSIFGMTADQMNAAASYAAWPNAIQGAEVYIYAGDSGGLLSLMFSGTIIRAIADYNAQPDVAFHIEARSGTNAQLLVLPPSSQQGQQNAANLLSTLAVSAGYTFENNSAVNVPLVNPYFRGSAMDQIRYICEAARINFVIENGVLAIWPKGQARQITGQSSTSSITVSNADGSMVGYPTFGGPTDMNVRCLYNPAIRYGASVTVQSSLPPANGTFFLYRLEHELQAFWPQGAWFSTLGLTTLSGAVPS